ncbi:MAG: hypothetical protein U0175_31560 [Caldilineaceae bacterium]
MWSGQSWRLPSWLWLSLMAMATSTLHMPLCPFAAPLSDVGHVGSIVLGLVAPAVAIWTLWRWWWRGQVQIGWVLPAAALLLVVATVFALSQAAVDF